jgi:glyoxylase-like metal-dependent hydrolase (beta-lactamase superfamily II)
VIVASSRDPRFLSNAFVVAGEEGGPAALIDAGAPVEPLLEAVERHRLRPTHLLLTHRHGDHTLHVETWVGRFGCEVYAHAVEAEHLPFATRTVSHGAEIQVGSLGIRVLHVPGHTAGHAAFVVDDRAVFCGDLLFRGSVGGTVGPGASGFADLRRSVLEVLLALPGETTIHPGHMESTTVARERETNPFVRAWTGRDAVLERRCRAVGRPATLLLRARDYDGGTKCWVRFDDGEEAVVPGSRVAETGPT